MPSLKIEKIWLPIFQAWLKTELSSQQVIHLAIDRTKWECINLLTVSLIWDKRALPIYWELLPKQANSNFENQITVISKIIPIFADYKIVVLGDREFCSVKLGNWLLEQKVYFCLRLKQNEFVLLEDEFWLQLNKLGLSPGMTGSIPIMQMHFLWGGRLAAFPPATGTGRAGCPPHKKIILFLQKWDAPE